MSDYKDKPPPPQVDWTKSTPNINLPGNPASSSGGGYVGSDPDWAKTNYRIDIPQATPPPARPPDDFGKTAINIKPIDVNRQDFGKTMYPGSGQSTPPADWGATQANVNIPPGDFGGSSGSDWESSGPAKTTPYFQLPESERAKYQLPPTATEQAAQQAEEQKAKGGIPGWVWVVAGLMTMFFFAIAALGVVYFFILRDSSYKATIKGAPPGSDIYIDDEPWGLSNEDGDSVIPNLAPGKKRTITIRHPSFTCDPMPVEGGRGEDPPPLIARCRASEVIQNTGDCTSFEPGEDDRAEACYNAALKALPDPYTPEQLVAALSILIINFDPSKFDVPTRRFAALQKAATYIKRLPADVIIEIGGHTDSDGTPAFNQRLSEQRANAVKDFLVKNGVNASILQVRGYGADRPKRENTTDAGKYMNRRIQYSVVAKPK